MYTSVQRTGVTIVEIVPGTAFHKQRPPRSNAVTGQVGNMTLRMTRRVERVQYNAAGPQRCAFFNADFHASELGRGRGCDPAASSTLHIQSGSEVIGINMCGHKRQH